MIKLESISINVAEENTGYSVGIHVYDDVADKYTSRTYVMTSYPKLQKLLKKILIAQDNGNIDGEDE